MSSPRDPRLFLYDVLDAANSIAEFTKGIDEDAYAANSLVNAAVERKFLIIGEALGQLAKVDRILAARIPEISRIIGFRNILVHGYASVDHERVWALTQVELADLRKVVEALLVELDRN